MPRSTLNWGIIGLGRIAHAFVDGIRLIPSARLYAGASKTSTHRVEFSEKYDLDPIYSDYQTIVQDPNIDIIYIATTQNFHYHNIKLALEHGKHVLCEKPLTLNAAQAQEVANLAKKKGLFLMEALWMRFLPVFQKIRQLINRGDLGQIRQLTAHFGYSKQHRKNNRLDNPALGGGVMLDMGIYPLSLAQMIFGSNPINMDSSHWMTPNGVDGHSTYFLDYGKGQTALLSASFYFTLKEEAVIYGDNGYIRIPIFHGAKRYYTVYNQDLDYQTTTALEQTLQGIVHDYPYQGHGFQFEIEEVHRCLEEDRIESKIMPLSDTIQLLHIMDQFRSTWNFTYPDETSQ